MFVQPSTKPRTHCSLLCDDALLHYLQTLTVFVAVYILQYFPGVVTSLWSMAELPPIQCVGFTVIFTNLGGVFNFLAYTLLRRRSKRTNPRPDTIETTETTKAWLLHWYDYVQCKLILGLYSLRRRRLISIGIPIINLRRSSGRLKFIMGIPTLVRRRFLSE